MLYKLPITARVFYSGLHIGGCVEPVHLNMAALDSDQECMAVCEPTSDLKPTASTVDKLEVFCFSGECLFKPYKAELAEYT